MRFCYHPDNVIYTADSFLSAYAEFMELHPDFPIIEGRFFDYKDGMLYSINSEGHNFPEDISEHQTLIQAIEAFNGQA